MTNAHNRFDNEGSARGIFVLGLLAGAVVGAGLGMLFAPKSGSDLRRDISEQAGNLANTASEGYKRATNAASEGYKRTVDAVDNTVHELTRA